MGKGFCKGFLQCISGKVKMSGQFTNIIKKLVPAVALAVFIPLPQDIPGAVFRSEVFSHIPSASCDPGPLFADSYQNFHRSIKSQFVSIKQDAANRFFGIIDPDMFPLKNCRWQAVRKF